jgi:hypothetical protein
MRKQFAWALAVLLLSGCGYNRIQELDEQTEQQKGNIETELMRRNDLIPNLVATVDQAAQHERGTFTEVARARSGLNAARDQLAKAVQGNAGAGEVSAANSAVSDQLRPAAHVPQYFRGSISAAAGKPEFPRVAGRIDGD